MKKKGNITLSVVYLAGFLLILSCERDSKCMPRTSQNFQAWQDYSR